MKLFDKIRILRKARGLSQEQLGYSLSRVNKDGISRQTISDWENGKFEPKLENIRDLADIFDVSFDTLLDESIDLDDEEVLDRVLNREHVDRKVVTPKQNGKGFYFSIRDIILFIINIFVLIYGLNFLITGCMNFIAYEVFGWNLLIHLVLSLPVVTFGGVSFGLLINSIIRKTKPSKSMVFLFISVVILVAIYVLIYAGNIKSLNDSYNIHSIDRYYIRMTVYYITMMVYYILKGITMGTLIIICNTVLSKPRKVKQQ